MRGKRKHFFVSGTIRVHPRGFGFLQHQERERFPEDIFIPKHAIQGAVDGDFVEIVISPFFISKKKPEGQVNKILRRGRSHVAGTILMQSRKEGIHAHVPLLGEGQLMEIVPNKKQPLQVGDRIIIHVLDWAESLGEMAYYIGPISDPFWDVPAAIEEYGLDDAFAQKVIDEAKAFGKQVNAKDVSNREDLRQLDCITIDPETAKDFDDALSLSRDPRGNFHLGVHIADVSHYIQEGSMLDKEARKRCNSVYFPGHVLPMLPHALSSHLCSLKPNVNRLAVSVLMTLDKKGAVKEYRIVRSVIKSKMRFTYQEAKAILDRKQKSKYAKLLFLMVDLCRCLKQQRYERGSIEFSLPDVSIKLTEKGRPKSIDIVEYDITHQLVEEFMLKANEIIAAHLSQQKKPLTYRVHEEPKPEAISDFAALANTLGFQIPNQPSTEQLQQLFDEARESPFGQFLATAFIRSMKLASYSTQNVGHYGLGLEHYTHFTSPIRRYVDLIVHRLLFNEVDPKVNLEQVALECSEKERLSARASQAVTLLKKLRLLQAMHKKDPHHSYRAVVTSVKSFGFAFELTDFLYEGFLPLSEIGGIGAFVFDKKRFRLTNRRSHQHFHTGSVIEVMLDCIDLITQKTSWTLSTPPPKTKRKQ